MCLPEEEPCKYTTISTTTTTTTTRSLNKSLESNSTKMLLLKNCEKNISMTHKVNKNMKQEESEVFNWQQFLSQETEDQNAKKQEKFVEDNWYHKNTEINLDKLLEDAQSYQDIQSTYKTEQEDLSASFLDHSVYSDNLKSEDNSVPEFNIVTPSSYSVPVSRSSSPSPNSKKRKFKVENDDDSNDFTAKKEKNRVAAQRYRQKLKEEASRVVEQVTFLEAQNEIIKAQIEIYKRQLDQDRKFILQIQLLMAIQNTK